MRVQSLRPDVGMVGYRLYERALHPELFDIRESALLTLEDIQLRLHVSASGHVVEAITDRVAFTEVVGLVDDSLPQRRLRTSFPIEGCRETSLRLPGGVQYHVSGHLERLDPDVFSRLHEELLFDRRRATVCAEFPPTHRWGQSSLSLIITDIVGRTCSVHTFHTWPEQHAIVRTQGLVEF